MQVVIDFTGPMSMNTGGATYPAYILPRWARIDTDRIAAVFSHGEAPADVARLGCVVELPQRTRRPSLDRVIDMHLGVRAIMRDRMHDVAYFPGNFIPLGLPRSLPKVVAIRSTLPFDYPAQVHPVRRHLQRWATRYAVQVAARIIVPSSSTADILMRSLGASRRQLVVVPHGVDLDLFRPDDRGARDPGLFLFVSRPGDFKGLVTVFRALHELHRAANGDPSRLVVVDGGLGTAETRQWQQMASRLSVDQHVDFAGRLDHPALSTLYRKAGALVLPSALESFGNPYVEAAATGCLVIGPRGHGIDETIGDAAITVPTHDHVSLARAMHRARTMNQRERGERATELRARAAQFSWDDTLARTREVLSEVA